MKTKLKPFNTTAPEKVTWDGGYAGGPGVTVSDLADKLFGIEIPGTWLCCYMLRRFGWPNEGSDPHKNLMSWTLTTPIEGLYLSVTPYLGGEPFAKAGMASNLHFAVRYKNDVGRKLDTQPGRERYFVRQSNAINRWWKTTGIKLYAWGVGLKEGDEDELVHTWSEAKAIKPEDQGKYVFGLWRRTKTVKGRRDLPKSLVMREWWLGKLIKEKHPEVKLPKMTAKERKETRGSHPFAKRCHIALQRTMLDLLRPTNVRDVNFNIFGKTEQRLKSAISRNLIIEGHVQPFDGAGNTPEYFFSPEGRKDIAKERAERAKSK